MDTGRGAGVRRPGTLRVCSVSRHNVITWRTLLFERCCRLPMPLVMCFDVLVDEDHGGLQKTPGGHQRGPPSAGSPSAIGTSVLMWRAAGRGLGPLPGRPRAQIPVASSDLAGRLTVAPWNGSESDRICGSQEKAQIDPSGRVWNPGRTAGSCCGPRRASRARSGPRCALCTGAYQRAHRPSAAAAFPQGVAARLRRECAPVSRPGPIIFSCPAYDPQLAGVERAQPLQPAARA